MSKILTAILVLLLLGTMSISGVIIVKYNELKKVNEKNLLLLKNNAKTQEVAQFDKMFIEKVLMSNKQVSFEERLALENAVRKLNDADILNQWNKFVESGDSVVAQGEVKKLLSLLADKIVK